MRLLLSLILAIVGVSTAHATTIDNFTYTYTLSGNTFTNTFSLVDGQGGTAFGSGQSYRVALNGNPAAQTTVEFTPNYSVGGLTFILDSSTQADLLDYGTNGNLAAIKDYSPTSLTFNSGFFAFDVCGVRVGNQN